VSSRRLLPFEAAVLETIRRRVLFGPSARVLVALSGGPDSTALLRAMAALLRNGELATLHACHVDHQLRAGSAADASACAALCRELEVPLLVSAVDVARDGSLQQAARRARYRALAGAAQGCGADHVATGHTRSDQAETVLLRLLRGAGARGLGGIPARRGRYVRPLIDRSRREVLEYLAEGGVAFLEDPSNTSPRFLRNRVRRELLPVIEALAPGAEPRLARLADLLRDDDRALERAARRLAPDGASSVDVARLARASRAVQRRVVRRLWRGATGSRRELEAVHVEAVLKLLRAGRRGPVALPGGRAAWRARGRVQLGSTETRRGFPVPPSVRVSAGRSRAS
jgi:tRNA(Ile)-lysidine synthase